MHPLKFLSLWALFTLCLAPIGLAQSPAQPAPEDSFASENAVLDTSILFAIGAREARQELRGAFGWPTFQEGLVEGVYFRFDPDGYARFAPSPRLDTDVFEVICRPRTLVCMGRKNAMQITLNSRGQIQLELANTADKDQFVLSDGITELPLPPSILQPLEPRLELLLAAGGEMIVRRNNTEVDRISLAGFGAVAAYLRWVAARQDYSVLPRDWPIPGASETPAPSGLTQTALWQSPMPQPQRQAAPASVPAAAGDPGVAEVRGELSVLRELLMTQQANAQGSAAAAAAPEPVPAMPAQEAALEARIAELMEMSRRLQEELARARGQMPAPAAMPDAPVQPEPAAPQASAARNVARHLEYLMTEIGLAPDVALMVVQQAQPGPQTSQEPPQAGQDAVIDEILKELRAQLPQTAQASQPDPAAPAGSAEYQLLTDYFLTVREE